MPTAPGTEDNELKEAGRVMARGRSDATPLLALGAVTLAIGALLVVLIAIGLAIYFFA
jgi:hypothetical protein